MFSMSVIQDDWIRNENTGYKTVFVLKQLKRRMLKPRRISMCMRSLNNSDKIKRLNSYLELRILQ